MKLALFSAKPYDEKMFRSVAPDSCPVSYFAARLEPATVPMARGFPAVCAFVHDVLDAAVLEALAEHGTRLVAMRCAGFNNVDTEAASRMGVTVARVPAYSPYSIAEHTLALMLALNRNIHRAHARVREGNFELNGLMGFDLYGRTVGIVGTGQIGARVAAALSGFGVRLLGHDLQPNPDCLSLGMRYVSLEQLFAESDIVTLHCPLTPDTHRLVNAERLALCKPGMMLINTGRGALIDAQAVIAGLKSGRIGYLGLDVYEQEESLFFHDRSNEVLQDDVFSRLQTFPNVLVTGHQGFFTRDALAEIARVTLDTVQAFGREEPIPAARVVVGQESAP